MNEGMLWLDNDPRIDLMQKIQKAANYYCRKYGVTPNTCIVNPSILKGQLHQESNIAIHSYDHILPGCLWIGVSDKN